MAGCTPWQRHAVSCGGAPCGGDGATAVNATAASRVERLGGSQGARGIFIFPQEKSLNGEPSLEFPNHVIVIVMFYGILIGVFTVNLAS